MSPAPSRRDFLRASALSGGGLLLALQLPAFARRAEAQDDAGAAPFAPHAWLRIGADGLVTVILGKTEMGQGVGTALPMLVAEELDADWATVRVEYADADPRYNDPGVGAQMTGGSSSVAGSWVPLRTAGAAAREMLVAAAAARWGVDPGSCATAAGTVTHAPTGRTARYGELATAAAALPVPAKPRLKDAAQFRLIGRPTPRLDHAAKLTGRAVFGIDVRVEGALVAVIARPKVFGATLKGFDATAALAIPGVTHVVQVSSGVAVVGTGYWPASQGRKALSLTWDEGAHAARSSATISAALRTAAAGKGPVVAHAGDADAALAAAHTRLDAEYEIPFLAHAMMEPASCTARLADGRCEVWAPTQFQTQARAVAAAAAKVPMEHVTLHTTLLGGGFGRKIDADFVVEAVETARLVGAPVKVIWSREDDIQHDYYRTAGITRVSAALDAQGNPVAYRATVACDSSLKRMLPMYVKDNVDPDGIEGAANPPYRIPNIHVEYVLTELGVPVGAWRSVGSSQNAFMRECFIDECAAAAGRDPVAYRRALLTDPGLVGVLDLAAERSGWGKPLPAGRFRGVATHRGFGTAVAQVAEISIENGAVKVHRITCAVDCGTVVNPLGARAQVEGGIIYGLTAALRGPITIAGGRVQQSNFNDYPMLRLREVPALDVHFVASTNAPTGLGEPAVPLVAPVLANAVRAATGQAVRSLPIRLAAARKAD